MATKKKKIEVKDSKPRVLCLLRLLEKYTDEEHQITTNDLIELLEKEYGFSTHRITLKKEIEALQDMGYDVVEIRSSQNKYYLRNRAFELAELKLLIDAIESSKFINEGQSEELIDKIHSLTSIYQVDKLKRDNYIVKKVKPNNENAFLIADAINDAINQKKQISFQCYDYTGLKKKVLRHKGEVYTLSPYHLVWNGDFYYVVGFSQKRNKVISFRVDRIATIPELIETEYVEKPKDFDLNGFLKAAFHMFEGEIVEVDLRVDNSLMKTIIDKFGEDVTTLAYDMQSFRVLTEVAISPTFFGWVFGFMGKIEILGPSSVKDEYTNMLINSNCDVTSNRQ